MVVTTCEKVIKHSNSKGFKAHYIHSTKLKKQGYECRNFAYELKLSKMKTIRKINKKTIWTRPGRMTHDEFMTGIRKAEEGPFYTLDEIKKNVADWKKENGYL